MIITRKIINPDITIYQHNKLILNQQLNYSQFCEMIDFWKLFLIDKYNAKSGDTCLIDFSLLNPFYYSCIFAVAELGIILIVDMPHCYSDDDINGYRVNMHGKIDYIITQKQKYNKNESDYNEWDCKRNAHLSDNIIFEEDLASYTVKNNKLFDNISSLILATPDTPLIYSSSSGTTGNPSKIVNSHRKVYFMAERMGRLLNFRNEDRVLHIRNIHHGASMSYHFLPSFMIAKDHYTHVPPNYENLSLLVEFVQVNKINHLFLYLQSLLEKYLEITPRVEHYLKITTLFNITPNSVQKVKDKNIQWIKTLYGDTTIGQGFFLKHVDQFTDLSTYNMSNHGKPLDDAFGIAVIDGRLHISIPALGEDWKTSNDKFDVINGDYYFRGRANRFRINEEWIEQRELESKVLELFGGGANIVIDSEYEKIYLAIWEDLPDAENSLIAYFKSKFQNVFINYVLRNHNKENFFNSRKLDLNKIREYCRKQN